MTLQDSNPEHPGPKSRVLPVEPLISPGIDMIKLLTILEAQKYHEPSGIEPRTSWPRIMLPTSKAIELAW